MNKNNQKVYATSSGTEEWHRVQETPNLSGKKLYLSPILKHQAHLRDVTLAPSPGFDESGYSAGNAGGGIPLNSIGDASSETSSGKIFDNIFEK